MNRRIVWIIALGSIAVWSLLTWGAYALVTGTGGFLAANADLLGGSAELQYWVQWSLSVLETFGVALVWIVWAIGTVAIVATAAIGAKALAALRSYRRTHGPRSDLLPGPG